ncbi:DUF2065 family protein [Patescibacteria group bacterium]|nr:DUF2065 family protein [Patescibacteria group bacterium]
MFNLMQTFGLILSVIMFAVGIAIIIRQNDFRKLIKEIIASKSHMFVMALFSLVFGVVVLSNKYQINGDLDTVVVVLGWMALLKGILILWVPDFMKDVSKRLILKATDSEMSLIGALEVVLGVALAYISIGFL